jgi:hypothetical protein
VRFEEDSESGDVFAICASIHYTSFSVVTEVTLPEFNLVNPFGDFGLLSQLFDPTNLFPVIILAVILGGFGLAWILSLCLDRRSYSKLEALRTAQFLKYGELQTGRGNDKMTSEEKEALKTAARRRAVVEMNAKRRQKQERARERAAKRGTFALLVHFVWYDVLDRIRRGHLWGSVFVPVSQRVETKIERETERRRQQHCMLMPCVRSMIVLQ